MKHRILFLASLMLGLLALICSPEEKTKADSGTGKLTILVYMTGSDLESSSGAAGEDLAEMERAFRNEGDVCIAALTGGTRSWQNGFPVEKNVLWKLDLFGWKPVREMDAESMGAPETLSRFLNDGVELFPAERYALVLWDHGGGPLEGICFDEQFSNNQGQDRLTLQELQNALAGSPFSGRPLELIGFDACLMATAEVASMAAPYARYMVASQETEPATGWNYSFLKDLTGEKSGAEIGEAIIQSYGETYQESLAPVTLSCLDLSMVPKMEGEIEKLLSGLGPGLEEHLYKRIAACRADVKRLGISAVSSWDLVDLKDFLEICEEYEGLDVSEAIRILEQMVISQYSNEEFVGGISIYAPFDNKPKYLESWGERYQRMEQFPVYRDGVGKYADLWLTPVLTDWNIPIPNLEKNDSGMHISLLLPEGAKNDLASARLLVLDAEGEEWVKIYETDDIRFDGRKLTAEYRNEILCVTDMEDSFLARNVSWIAVENGIAVGAVREIIEFGIWKASEPLYLIFRTDPEGEYKLSEIYAYHEGIGMFTPSALQLQDGDSLTFVNWMRYWPEDTDLPYEKWPFGEHVQLDYAEIAGTVLKAFFARSPADNKDRYAIFELKDFRGNTYLSKPASVSEWFNETFSG